MQGILSTTNYKSFCIQTPSGETLLSFTGASLAGKALPGDTVEWSGSPPKCTVLHRAKQPPIVGILEVTSKTKYGTTSRGNPVYLFAPSRKEYPFFLVGCSERNVTKNILAQIQFHEWTTTGFPRGNLVRTFGRVGELDAERDLLIRTYHPYPPPSCPDAPITDWMDNDANRISTPPCTFNIDPDGCKDIDDVLSIQVGEETTQLWITIADVAEMIPSQSTLDKEAQIQGCTAYADGQAVRPMLPRAYSEDACSLLPQTSRPGISLIVYLSNDSDHTILRWEWKVSHVRNQFATSYETFVQVAQDRQIPIDVIWQFAKQVLKRPTMDPHEWIEACMVFYNIQVAKILRKQGRGLLRKHAQPDLEKLAFYKSLGRSELEILANRSAVYTSATDPEPLHWGLHAQLYCHATSPIRRYADLVNQRILKDYMLGTTTPIEEPCTWLNRRQIDAKRMERDLFFLQQVQIGTKGSISGLVLARTIGPKDGSYPITKVKLWIAEWKRLVNWNTTTDLPASIGPGVEIRLHTFANPNVRLWKDKLIFQYAGIV